MRFPRASGVLLHITSLPGPNGSGDFGPSAYHFVDWLHTAGQSLWQILPLTGVGPGNSPYMSSSAFAGNLMLIDLSELHRHGWLTADEVIAPGTQNLLKIDFGQIYPFRMSRLKLAAERFRQARDAETTARYQQFCQEQAQWLDDFALFMTLAEASGWRDWCDWDAALARRNPQALAQAHEHHAERVAFWKFCQWCFFHQWHQLKGYANARGIKIVGDVPIFLAHQSAEVWCRPELFELDGHGRPTVIAGVPPDVFSATGQRWGNPLYRWSAHEAEHFQWWTQRIQRCFDLVDLVRIDHFRGFEAYWEVPASEATAVHGRWVKAPGDALFCAVTAALGPQPIIAEDLGIITPEVDHLRRKHGFPGMRILQFAWGETGEPRFLPHQHEPDTVVYTGSHDNDTTLGWWEHAPEVIRHHLREYLASDGRDVGWDLIRTACASVGDLAIYPMQDILRLRGEHRMNLPGSSQDNWSWRFDWSQVDASHADRLRHMCALYDRLPT